MDLYCISLRVCTSRTRLGFPEYVSIGRSVDPNVSKVRVSTDPDLNRLEYSETHRDSSNEWKDTETNE